MAEESLHPQTLTFDAGMDFIRRNQDRDSWFLQIEAFDPHEPFFAPKKYQALYPESWSGPEMDWPQYRLVREDPETVAHVRRRYFALLSMCDHSLGRVLDAFDQFGLWQDTMLIVCTDHGYMLGEHGYWAKNYMRPYEEVVHTPLFIWDPRCGVRNERRKALVQTIDLPVTLLSFFGAPVPPDMRGKDLLPAMERDEPVREGALFGWFGRHVGYTDGRYFYVQAPVSENRPLYEYTLLPTRMDSFFPADVLKTMEKSRGFSFTKGLPVMRFEPEVQEAGKLPADDWTVLYDLQADPLQQSPLEDGELARGCRAAMSRLMKEEDAPPEQWQRLGLQEMAADIVSLIRRYAIGSPLQSHETRVKNAIQKLKRAHRFSRQELNWIDRIGTYLLNESVISTKVFDEDVRFRSQGGYARINKAFHDQLDSIIAELNDYLYDDGGKTA